MKHAVLIPLTIAALLQSSWAASDNSGDPCDSNSEAFYRRQTTVTWQPVPAERVAEADYHGRTFETRIREQERDVYAYRVLMNMQGKPIYVSVALLDRPQEIIDVERLAAEARMFLQNEAMKVVRERRDKKAFLALSDNRHDILLWSWRSSWYFSVDAPEDFSVFRITGNTVELVCSYPGAE